MKQIHIKEKPGFAYWIKTQTDSALRESITESFQAGRMLQPGCSATGRGPEGRGCREKGQIILFFSSHQTYSGLFCMTLSPIHGAHVANMYEGKKHARRCHPTSSLSRTETAGPVCRSPDKLETGFSQKPRPMCFSRFR